MSTKFQFTDVSGKLSVVKIASNTKHIYYYGEIKGVQKYGVSNIEEVYYLGQPFEWIFYDPKSNLMALSEKTVFNGCSTIIFHIIGI